MDAEKSLYEILGIERTASQQETKKEAKEKFQILQNVISVLGDEEKRAIYDQTGCVDDVAFSSEAAENLQQFFRSMFRKVTEADIEEFEANYRGSDSEKKDLKAPYKRFKGNMRRLFCSMLCSDPKLDSHRFDIIDEAIARELKTTKANKKWAKKISETKPPIDPLVRRAKSKKWAGMDLVAAITQHRKQRKEQFDSIISSIISKCSGQATREPTEEEFQRAWQRLGRKQTKRGKHYLAADYRAVNLLTGFTARKAFLL